MEQARLEEFRRHKTEHKDTPAGSVVYFGLFGIFRPWCGI